MLPFWLEDFGIILLVIMYNMVFSYSIELNENMGIFVPFCPISRAEKILSIVK